MGHLTYSQIRGSLKNANQVTGSMLRTWMENDRTHEWGEGFCFVHNMEPGVYQRGIKCSLYESMYGSLKQISPNTSYPPDGGILNLQTKEEREAGFTRTGDNEYDGRDTDTSNNEIMDDAAQEHDNMSFGRKLKKKKK